MLNVLSEHSLNTIKCGVFSLTLFSKLQTNCLSVFDRFVGLALKGSRFRGLSGTDFL